MIYIIYIYEYTSVDVLQTFEILCKAKKNLWLACIISDRRPSPFHLRVRGIYRYDQRTEHAHTDRSLQHLPQTPKSAPP